MSDQHREAPIDARYLGVAAVVEEVLNVPARGSDILGTGQFCALVRLLEDWRWPGLDPELDGRRHELLDAIAERRGRL
jgi:hypothetical protein